jgi:hypothetical protein
LFEEELKVMGNSTLNSCLNKAYLSIFSVRHITAYVRNIRQHFSTPLGIILKIEITNIKAQKCKTCYQVNPERDAYL